MQDVKKKNPQFESRNKNNNNVRGSVSLPPVLWWPVRRERCVSCALGKEKHSQAKDVLVDMQVL